jgi:hypothetical protein
MPVSQMPVGQMPIGQMPVGQMFVGQMFFDQKPLNQIFCIFTVFMVKALITVLNNPQETCLTRIR